MASLGKVAQIRVSNVDKKSLPGEEPVRLCNYLDVYKNDYLGPGHPYMAATATLSEIETHRLWPGDVVVTKDSETPDDIGVPAVIDSAEGMLLCGYHLAVIRSSNELDPTFLAKQLGGPRVARQFARMATGSTRYGLSVSAIEKLEILLPPPSEQRRISKLIRTFDEAIRRTEQVIAKLKQMKQGLLHDLLTRGIDENGELRDPVRHPEQFKDSPLGRIPREWNVRKIGHLSGSFAGGTPSRSVPGSFGGGIPWVKSAEVGRRGGIYWTEETVGPRAMGTSSLKWVEAKTPLMAMYGATAGVVGWLGIRATTNQAVLALPPHTGVADARWMYWALSWRSDSIISLQQGSGQPNLSKSVIDAALLVLPSSLTEQREVALTLDSMESLIESEIKTKEKLRLLKTGLAEDLLSGRVRVFEDNQER